MWSPIRGKDGCSACSSRYYDVFLDHLVLLSYLWYFVMKHHTRKLHTTLTNDMHSALYPILHDSPGICFHFNYRWKKLNLSILEAIDLNIMQIRLSRSHYEKVVACVLELYWSWTHYLWVRSHMLYPYSHQHTLAWYHLQLKWKHIFGVSCNIAYQALCMSNVTMSALLASLVSVHISPSHRIKHRNFMFGTHMHLFPLHMHIKYIYLMILTKSF